MMLFCWQSHWICTLWLDDKTCIPCSSFGNTLEAQTYHFKWTCFLYLNNPFKDNGFLERDIVLSQYNVSDNLGEGGGGVPWCDTLCLICCRLLNSAMPQDICFSSVVWTLETFQNNLRITHKFIKCCRGVLVWILLNISLWDIFWKWLLFEGYYQNGQAVLGATGMNWSLKNPLELFMKRREFLAGSGFLSLCDMT